MDYDSRWWTDWLHLGIPLSYVCRLDEVAGWSAYWLYAQDIPLPDILQRCRNSMAMGLSCRLPFRRHGYVCSLLGHSYGAGLSHL